MGEIFLGEKPEKSHGVTNSCAPVGTENSASQEIPHSWANWDVGHSSRGDTATSLGLGTWTGLPQLVRIG